MQTISPTKVHVIGPCHYKNSPGPLKEVFAWPDSSTGHLEALVYSINSLPGKNNYPEGMSAPTTTRWRDGHLVGNVREQNRCTKLRLDGPGRAQFCEGRAATHRLPPTLDPPLDEPSPSSPSSQHHQKRTIQIVKKERKKMKVKWWLAICLLLVAGASADKKSAAKKAAEEDSKAEAVIEDVNAKQLERLVEEKDYVAVYWCKFRFFSEFFCCPAKYKRRRDALLLSSQSIAGPRVFLALAGPGAILITCGEKKKRNSMRKTLKWDRRN